MSLPTVIELFRYIHDSHRQGRDILDILSFVGFDIDPKDVEGLLDAMIMDNHPEIEDERFSRTLMKISRDDGKKYDLTFKGLKLLFSMSPDLIEKTYEEWKKDPHKPSMQTDFLALETILRETSENI